MANPKKPAGEAAPTYERFDLLQRLQHILFLISFTILALTGLAQKYSLSPISLGFLSVIGGVEIARIIHRVAAMTMAVVSAYHVLDVLYRIFVLRTPLTMLPWIDDIKHVIQDVLYYVGLRPHRAQYGHYSYAEKAEYFALVWGTLVMGLTGFMMWNPITTIRFLPGEAIPAAKAAHGGEAVLAVLAIILWHFYHVHLKHFNKSMFTGVMTRAEMEHEHPAELIALDSAEPSEPIEPEVLVRRRLIFFPFAALLTAAFAWGLAQFIFIEQTAVASIPEGETAQVYLPITPTPTAVVTPVPTATLIPGVAEVSWYGRFDGLFHDRCGTCHGMTSVGGLSLANYQFALRGGKSGPAIVPGNPTASILVAVQSTGRHPGQLTSDEIQEVIDWIKAGAPER